MQPRPVAAVCDRRFFFLEMRVLAERRDRRRELLITRTLAFAWHRSGKGGMYSPRDRWAHNSR